MFRAEKWAFFAKRNQTADNLLNLSTTPPIIRINKDGRLTSDGKRD